MIQNVTSLNAKQLKLVIKRDKWQSLSGIIKTPISNKFAFVFGRKITHVHNSTAPYYNLYYSEGKLPSTVQVKHAIETVQKSDALQAPQGMSPLGKKVLGDVERLLDTTKKI